MSLTTPILSPSPFLKRTSILPRPWKRRRLKTLNCHLIPPSPSTTFENIFQTLISQFPNPNSLNYIAPTLALSSALFLFSNSPNSKSSNPNPTENPDLGEFILFTSPTPFNRFVTLRCPSIYFPGTELLDSKLVSENRHFVKLNTGRMVGKTDDDVDNDVSVVYQRICVTTNDGGVLSLDWPSNLDLENEHGLDTTVLIVPGTAEGSHDTNVKAFVCDCLRTGVFPVVINPRGTAGSPLTTPRLFTAADSDDISTAVQFINKKRPWTTLMGVGWGYGANMLTKYLAEFGDKTPLTAATCIDNPFDLEEAMRPSVYNVDFDQRLTNGLIGILQLNKELFQGRGKGFDVEGALSASCVRDFEEAISMVAYGFDTIEDFYAKSSTRDVVGKVKIPLLFIQNNVGTAPLFSIPRSSIAENPYTSLLLCSYAPSTKITDGRLTLSWCQHLTLEWLTAVELGLLKGRHPLLEDVDVTINPSKGLSLVENRASRKSGRVDRLLDVTNVARPTNSSLKVFEADYTAANVQSRSPDNIVSVKSSSTIDAIEEKGDESSEDERGKVLVTAQVVMNMLDVTMPDTLSDEQKKKVLKAVGKGDTVIKALQDAVPEDVRGKLTNTVTEILQSRGSNLKFDKLLSLGDPKKVEKIEATKANSDDDKVHSSDQKKINNDSENGSVKVDSSLEEGPPGSMELENQSSDQKQSDTGTSQSTGNHGSSSRSETPDTDNVSEINANQESKPPENSAVNQKKVEKESFEGQSTDQIGVNNNFSTDQNKEDKSSTPLQPASGTEVVETEAKNSEKKEEKAEVVENEANKSEKKEEKGSAVVSSSANSDALPNISVSQAFDALTGFDDSTQVAVNSVFNVIEDMIDHLDEEGKDNEKDNQNVDKQTGKVEKLSENSVSKNHIMNNNDHNSERTENLKSKESPNSGNSANGTLLYDDPAGSGHEYKEQHHTYLSHNTTSSDTNTTKGQFEIDNGTSVMPPSATKLTAGNLPECPNSSSEKIPSHLSTFPYGDQLPKDYLKTYLHSNMRNADPLNVDKTSALFLKNIPDDSDPVKTTDNIIEPSYVILDPGKPDGKNEEVKEMIMVDDNIDVGDARSEGSMPFIKKLILECLNVEVCRRASAADMGELKLQLSRDIEHVADAVTLAVAHGKLLHLGTIDGGKILKVVSSSVEETQYLKRVLPVGVIAGATLAAIRKFFHVTALDGYGGEEVTLDQLGGENLILDKEKTENQDNFDSSIGEEEEDDDNNDLEENTGRNNRVMVGAVTAALGASALFVHQQNSASDGTSDESLEEEDNRLEDRPQNNIVTSFAEKAMSVASPVVPTKDGEVDHQRLVGMLAELGQRGGMFQMVSKVALLWGGIRGAMSLADKLMTFLRIADRPLLQRILGFASMVLLLWSPFIIPLLPTIIGSWGTRPFKAVELACIAGLYVSIMIMVTLWGKRIRNYDDPLVQYGMDLTSLPKLQNFVKGLVGGGVLVLLIHSVNCSLGCAHLCWPTGLSASTSEPVVAVVKSCGRMLMLILKAIATATGVSVVEELLFRSWLPREIAADYGYHRGVIISGLVFALSQRSKWEVPGLWLLSLGLSGAQQRSQGSLSLPIGLRTGMLASNFILKTGGLLTYHQANLPLWVTGVNPFQPFSGVVGLAFSLVLAIILYPSRPPLQRTKTTRVIRD